MRVEIVEAPAPWTSVEMERLSSVVDALVLPFGWTLRLTYDGSTMILQVQCTEGTDNVTGAPLEWRGRKWLLSRHMTAGEIAQTVLKATLTAAEHEIRELLFYGGQPIFDPHYDIEKLVELRRRPDALKERQ